jgi:hypothetical protein
VTLVFRVATVAQTIACVPIQQGARIRGTPGGARGALNRNTAIMAERIAARLVTGPVAFLLGGVLDVLAYAAASARGGRGLGPRRSRG